MTDFSELTRKIYHDQHNKIAKDKTAMKRFINMFSHEYFNVDKDFFADKKILDAGCGNTAKVIIAMHNLGAKEIHGFDLGSEFIPFAKESYLNYGVPEEKVHLTPGNLLDIPYPDEYFDFVICHGVLLHLNNLKEVKQAFSELSRVTKRNGLLYTVYGLVGGLFEGAIIPALRKYYREHKEFKELIDRGSPRDYAELLDFIETESQLHEEKPLNVTWIKNLFDTDFCVFLQNAIQAPVRLEINENFIKELYQSHNFNEIKRLHRYVKRENIRKFFSPLHYNTDNKFSKILYGSGNLEFIGKKG